MVPTVEGQNLRIRYTNGKYFIISKIKNWVLNFLNYLQLHIEKKDIGHQKWSWSIENMNL